MKRCSPQNLLKAPSFAGSTATVAPVPRPHPIRSRALRSAELPGDWAAHSHRSGFVTEGGGQGVPLGEVMEMTEHRSVGAVMGYFKARALFSSRATDLLTKK